MLTHDYTTFWSLPCGLLLTVSDLLDLAGPPPIKKISADFSPTLLTYPDFCFLQHCRANSILHRLLFSALLTPLLIWT